MTRLSRFLALAPPDRVLFLQACVAGPLIRLALATLGFRRCRMILASLSQESLAASRAADDAMRVVRMARAAARHGGQQRHCLPESLTLWWLLRRCGIESEIRIGVRKESGGVDAHAWVEWGGSPLDEPPDVEETFEPLVRPAAG